MYHVCALYRFAAIEDVAAARQRLLAAMEDGDVRGTLLVAPEGINGTIAGDRAAVELVLDKIKAMDGFDELNVKWSTCHHRPFKRCKVRIKSEIVTMGVPAIDPNRDAGQYVDAVQWNALMDDPEVVVIDTRNDYETAIGKFEEALDPQTESFREFPEFVSQKLDPAKTPKVAMYCTGGIRCEKATSLLKQRGFDQVYHLRGGILEYLRTVDPDDSRWRGDCFVFDDRVALDHELSPSGHRMCHACGWPIPPDQIDDPRYIAGVQCPRCADRLTDDQKRRFAMRQSQLDASAASPPDVDADAEQHSP